jgi:hypothetical protein
MWRHCILHLRRHLRDIVSVPLYVKKDERKVYVVQWLYPAAGVVDGCEWTRGIFVWVSHLGDRQGTTHFVSQSRQCGRVHRLCVLEEPRRWNFDLQHLIPCTDLRHSSMTVQAVFFPDLEIVMGSDIDPLRFSTCQETNIRQRTFLQDVAQPCSWRSRVPECVWTPKIGARGRSPRPIFR